MEINQIIDGIILDVLGEQVSKADMKPSALLVEHLGATSIQLLEIALTIAAEFDIDVPKEELKDLHSVGDVYRIVAQVKHGPLPA